MSLLESALRKTKKTDITYLSQTKIPIVTVSGSYKEDLKGLHSLSEDDILQDVVLSRAHYSMALGVAIEAWDTKIDPKKAWLADPTNYVTPKQWKAITSTEFIGKILARYSVLKKLKDLVDRFGRQKLPILGSITPPLLSLTHNIQKPILSFHIAAGNILLEQGKTVFQMVTDPHVREDYLAHSEKKHAFYGVFDEKTQKEFLEKAQHLGKDVEKERVIVTGPPIDPRILDARSEKSPWKTSQPLKICITTGGLGTNKSEIQKILTQLLPELGKAHSPFEVMVYAGTHGDIHDMVVRMAQDAGVAYTKITPVDPAQFQVGKKITLKPQKKITHTPLKILYHPQIIDANELLIAYGFPWADVFISKPSGDMAYDAVASGAAFLSLAEWGEWEHNIRIKFEHHGVSQQAEVKNMVAQLEDLMTGKGKKAPWIQQAQHAARTLEKEDRFFRKGAKNILKAVEKLSEMQMR